MEAPSANRTVRWVRRYLPFLPYVSSWLAPALRAATCFPAPVIRLFAIPIRGCARALAVSPQSVRVRALAVSTHTVRGRARALSTHTVRVRALATSLAAVLLLLLLALATPLHADPPPGALDPQPLEGVPLIVLEPTYLIADARIDECSGIEYLHGRFWVHNDSGAGPKVYSSPDLRFRKVARHKVKRADAVDWEDIAIFGSDLLICDIGDNRRERPAGMLYRIKPKAGKRKLDVEAAYPVSYPDGPHDAEAAFAIGTTFYIVTKDRGEGTWVYRYDDLRKESDLPDPDPDPDRDRDLDPDPDADSGLGAGASPAGLDPDPASNVGVRHARLDLGEGEMVTGATYDPVREKILLLTYSAIMVYSADRFEGQPDWVTRMWARQAESICMYEDAVVVTNEESEVFVLEDFLERGIVSALPPRSSISLETARQAELPLRGTIQGEGVTWWMDGSSLVLEGTLRTGREIRTTDAAAGKIGSAVILSFGIEPTPYISDQTITIAFGPSTENEPLTTSDPEATGDAPTAADPAVTAIDPTQLQRWQAWSVHLPKVAGTRPDVVPDPTIEAEGTADQMRFHFRTRIPLDRLSLDRPSSDGRPAGATSLLANDSFLFDLHGSHLCLGDQVYLSGQGLFTIYRPYMWGTVSVVSR